MNQIMGIDVQKHVIDACKKVIKKFAVQSKIEQERLFVRIDKENLEAKPVFGIFDQSTHLFNCSLNDVIRAAGGGAFALVLNVEIRKIFTEIFRATLKEFEIKDTKRIFLLLYVVKMGEEYVPLIAVYKDGEFVSAIPAGDIVGGAEDNG